MCDYTPVPTCPHNKQALHNAYNKYLTDGANQI